jgi:predicted MPP superfamily phosphohydrolase
MWGSVWINLFVALSDWVLQSLHARGWMQRPLAFVDGFASILKFPGYTVIHRTGIREALSSPHRISVSAWFILILINTVFWMVALRLLLGILFPRRGPIPTDTRIPGLRCATPRGVAQRSPGITDAAPLPMTSRRRFLTSTARVAAGGLTTATAYSMLLETRWFGVSRRKFPVRGLPPELAGLRIVQLTDIHHGPTLSLNYVRQVVRATNALQPDLILLTGDYVHRSSAYVEPVVRELAELRATIGRIGVLGNHDWWEDAPLTRRAFARIGIPLVDNDRLFITPERQVVRSSTAGLCIAGVGDLQEDVVRIGDALGNVPAEMPRLLMSHNPDVAEDPDFLRSRLRVDLMLCGHTHGGQVWIPGLGTPIVPSRYGQKYASGLVQGPACPVYISRGIGTTILPLRFCVPPEIAVIELEVG